jgi:hypothetical protein
MNRNLVTFDLCHRRLGTGASFLISHNTAILLTLAVVRLRTVLVVVLLGHEEDDCANI